nr:immunoglobulin heavy chain junction region [Mus musculus]
CARGLRHYW